jgi:cobalt/nickel transport system permease protein
MARCRTTLGTLVTLGLVVALVFAFFVGPHASSSPDGLERVASDTGIDDKATDHAFADGPLADYGVEGVDDEGLSTGLAGVVGVALTFVLGAGVLLLVRKARGRTSGSAAAAG